MITLLDFHFGRPCWAPRVCRDDLHALQLEEANIRRGASIYCILSKPNTAFMEKREIRWELHMPLLRFQHYGPPRPPRLSSAGLEEPFPRF